MKTHVFVAHVRATAGIESEPHARRATVATLEVLGRRLGSERVDLAAQLPPDLARPLTANPEVERFDEAEFYRLVAEREGLGCDEDDARRHARAVTATLRAAVGPEYDDVVADLPDDWREILQAEAPTAR